LNAHVFKKSGKSQGVAVLLPDFSWVIVKSQAKNQAAPDFYLIFCPKW
jgi:hypothetical protein